MDPSSPFVFALCNPGSERSLKLEAMELGWKPSYQRRGFVTFKAAEGEFEVTALDAEIACARRLCLSLGRLASVSEAQARLEQHQVARIHRLKFEDHRIRPQAAQSAERGLPDEGERIGTLVELGDGEVWAGLHLQRPMRSPDAGGDGGLEMPQESPSRAWLKLEEAVRFFGLEFTADDIVVELGCAPGGVVHALLQRGVPVIGVDPAAMAEVVTRHAIAGRDQLPAAGAWFYHCRKPAALVSKRDLGQGVSWFMSDMNQAPEVVLRECARFVAMAPSIRGVLITLKLTALEQVAEQGSWRDAMRAMGFGHCRVQQLAVHHREVALLALR